MRSAIMVLLIIALGGALVYTFMEKGKFKDEFDKVSQEKAELEIDEEKQKTKIAEKENELKKKELQWKTDSEKKDNELKTKEAEWKTNIDAKEQEISKLLSKLGTEETGLQGKINQLEKEKEELQAKVKTLEQEKGKLEEGLTSRLQFDFGNVPLPIDSQFSQVFICKKGDTILYEFEIIAEEKGNKLDVKILDDKYNAVYTKSFSSSTDTKEKGSFEIEKDGNYTFRLINKNYNSSIKINSVKVNIELKK